MEDATGSTLGEILQNLVQRHGWQPAQWLSIIQAIWSEIVGDTISQHTRILSLTTDGHLWVAVPSSVWSQELLYYKSHILEAIHAAFPLVPVHDIRTRVKANPSRPAIQTSAALQTPYFFTTKPALDVTQDLYELLRHVQEKYQIAKNEWLQNGFTPCVRCQAPTLKNYRLCVVCEMQGRR